MNHPAVMISRQFKFFLLLIFLVTTTLVVILQYNANKNIDELVDGNESLLGEFQMKTRLQDLRNDLLSIDNKVRTNIITDDEERRTGIDEEVASVKASVKELGEMLVTDSSRRLWDELNVLTDEKIRHSYKVLDTLSGSGKQAAEDFINERKGIQLSEAIERISTQLDYMRQNYLTQIIRETDANSIRAKRLGLIMGLLAIGVFLFAFWHISNRIRKQQEMIVQLNESEKKVREAAQVKEHFIANMSHEIRTPMNAILGFTNLLQKQPLENLPKQYVQSIQSSSENLLNIINDVLDLSKIEAGMMRIEKTPLSIRGLVHSVYQLFASKAEEKKLDFTFTVANSIPDVLIGDAVRITQLLVNLVSNAIKFTDKGFVLLTITANEVTDDNLHLAITVSDSGIGIDRSNQQHIFERFTQAEEHTTRRFGGTGLGLSIVQQITTLLDGNISLESELNKGSLFKVILPFAIAKEQIDIKTSFNQPDHQPGTHSIHLLVVEDNVMNQTLMQHLLTSWQMDFDMVPDGNAAIKILQEKNFDLVLMDIQMPGMDGYTTTQIIRNKLKLHVPIIAMTAHAFAGEREKCISYGMTDYIPKPVRESDLYRLITTLTRQADANHQNENISSQNGNISLKNIDLRYLRELSGGNALFEKQILEQFIVQAPEELCVLENAVHNKDWKLLRSTTHSLKTTVSFLGLGPLLASKLEVLEAYTGNNNEPFIASVFNEVKCICNDALQEAKTMTQPAI